MAEPMVLTPGGYRPKSQVQRVDPGQILRMVAGRLQKYDLSGKKLADLGEHPRRTGSGPLMPGQVQRAPTAERLPAATALANGWIVYTYWNNGTGNAITSFKSTWLVPPAPASQSGQTIFLFNAIQNSSMIYQPVLQWGISAAGGGNYWAVASWYADGQNGPAYHSPLIPVNVGDNLVGIMTLSGQSGNQFSYDCKFQGIPASNLAIQGIPQLTWCAETLEAYGLTKCSDYPPTAKTSFTGIEILVGGQQAPVQWTPASPITDCGQRAAVVSNASPGGAVDLYYSHWDIGFSGFAAIAGSSGNAHVWAYKASNGTVCIHQINAGGNGFTQKYFYKWDTAFSSFVGFSLAGFPYVWAYKAGVGTVCIHQINAGGNGFTQKFLYKWDTGFSGFATITDSLGNPYVWAYRASDGTVCIHQINAGGNGFTQKYFYKWDTAFSGFVGFSLSGLPYVWAYKASGGTVCIHQINAGGNGFTQKSLYKWDTGFSGFATISDSSGNAYVWAYRANDGTVCIHQINAGGNGFTQKYFYKWDIGFSSFVGFSLAGIPYVWAYRASDGTVCIHEIQPGGNGFRQVFMY